MSRLLQRLKNIQWFIIDYLERFADPQRGVSNLDESASHPLTIVLKTPADQKRQTYNAIGNGTNDFLIVVVAGAGFFTDRYLVWCPSNVLWQSN